LGLTTSPSSLASFSHRKIPKSQSTAPIAICAGARAHAAASVFRLLCFPVSVEKKLGYANGWWLRALVLRHSGVIGVTTISHRAPPPSRNRPSSWLVSFWPPFSVSTLPIASYSCSLRVAWFGLENSHRNHRARGVRPWRRRAELYRRHARSWWRKGMGLRPLIRQVTVPIASHVSIGRKGGGRCDWNLAAWIRSRGIKN
jgi:hypothetical protein